MIASTLVSLLIFSSLIVFREIFQVPFWGYDWLVFFVSPFFGFGLVIKDFQKDVVDMAIYFSVMYVLLFILGILIIFGFFNESI